MEKRRWLKDNIFNIIQTVPIIAIVVGAVMAWLQGVAWYLIVSGVGLIAIIAIPMTLLVINQNAVWKDRHGKRLTQYSNKEIANTIRDWVDISAWVSGKGELSPDLLLHYAVTISKQHTVHILRQQQEPDVIQLAIEVPLVREGKPLSEQQWDELTGNLSIDMAHLGIQWSFVRDNQEPKLEKPSRIRLVDSVIFDDSLTGFYFRERIMFVIRALVLVDVKTNAFYGGIPEPPTPDKGDSQT